MKKALFAGVLAIALGISSFSQAQTPPAGGPGWGGGNCRGGGAGMYQGGGRGMGPGWGMMRDLNLSQQQQQQIAAIMDKQHADTQKQVRAILTADQRKVFEQRQTERDAWHQQRRQRMLQQPAPDQ